MATLKIPTSSEAYYRQRTQLNGVSYVFVFKFNSREGIWSFDLLDQDEDPIALGVRVVVGVELLRWVVDSRKPTGTLLCVDLQSESTTLQDSRDPGIFELGARWVLMYLE